MGLLKKLAGQSAIYGISSILGKSINFLLVPLYTGYLPKEELGSFTMLYAMIAFLNVIFTFGMETTYFRFSTGKGLDPKVVFQNAQSLVAGKSLTFALLKLVNIVLNVGFNILFIVVAYHIAEGEILQALRPVVSEWYNPDWGVDYILLANLLANLLILPILWKLAGQWKFQLKRTILKPMWHYALPLLFMGLAGVINEVFSRGLFEYALPEGFYPELTSREAGGVFGANFKLAILMSLIIQAFKYAAEPIFFQQSENKNNPLIFARVMHWFIIFCTFLMVAVAVNLKLIGALFFQDEGYAPALPMVPLLLMGYLLLGIYYNLSIWFKITDQTRYSFYITLVGAIVTLVIILTLVPVLGYIGGALSTFGSYLVMVLLCYFIGQKYYPIPYQTKKDISYLLIAFVLSYAGFLLDTGSLIVNFTLHFSIILLYGGFIFLMEKKELSSLLKTIFKK